MVCRDEEILMTLVQIQHRIPKYIYLTYTFSLDGESGHSWWWQTEVRVFQSVWVLMNCLSGEIGRHKGFKIPRLMVVPVRVRPEAPEKDCTFMMLKL